MGNEPMDLQKLTFFTEGNTFTGSRTKDPSARLLLRYLVRPDLENGRLLCYAWDTDVCFEKAGARAEAGFPLDGSGLEEAGRWLLEQFDQL